MISPSLILPMLRAFIDWGVMKTHLNLGTAVSSLELELVVKNCAEIGKIMNISSKLLHHRVTKTHR